MTYNQTCEALQKAITLATQGNLRRTIEEKAFIRTGNDWIPRSKCLSEYYSGGEAVICGILLCWAFELYGSGDIVIPASRRDKIVNTPADIVWAGGWYFVRAIHCLSDSKCLEAIKVLLF